MVWCKASKMLGTIKITQRGSSLAVQWLGLSASTAEGLGLIPGRGTKIPQATWWGQKKRERKKKKQLRLAWMVRFFLTHRQLTLEQHRFELHGATYTGIFSIVILHCYMTHSEVGWIRGYGTVDTEAGCKLRAQIFNYSEGQLPNPQVVQGSTIIRSSEGVWALVLTQVQA